MIRIDARLLGIAGAAAIVLAACGGGNSDNGSGSSGDNQAAGSTNSVVSMKNISGAGKVLVDSKGMTLYTSEQEKNGKIMCTGACTGFWMPLTVSGKTVSTPAGVTGKLATVKRPDGKTQVTYNGGPLYTFRLDKSSGDDKGNNFSDSFSGTKFTWHAAGTTKSSTSNSGNNNGGNDYGNDYGGGY